MLNIKYPEQYLEHFLSMFSVNHNQVTDDTIEEHIEMYLMCEDKEEFIALQNETKHIIENQDIELFLDPEEGFCEDFSVLDLTNICKAIINYQVS